MPTLLVAMTFFSFAQFLGSIYSANKKTGMAFVTNLLGVIINLALSFALIKPLGVMGCAVATAVSYFVLWISRVINTRKIVSIKHKTLTSIVAVLILCMQCVLISFENTLAYVAVIILFFVLILIFYKTFIELINFGISIIRKVLNKGAQNG